MHSPCRPHYPAASRSWIALAAPLLLLAGNFTASAQLAGDGAPGALQPALATQEPGALQPALTTQEPGALQPPLATQEPGALQPPLAKNDPARDCRLTLRARQAIQNDPALAGITHLGVSVRAGVASLFGSVASPEAARRAEMLIRQVPGIVEVRNEIQVQSADDPLVLFLQSNRAGKVARGPTPQWVSANRPTGLLLSRSEEPTPPPSNISNNVTLMPPITLVVPAADPDLRGRITAIQQSDPKFIGTVADVQNGVVRLGGTVTRWEDIFALARAISHLPGVERVILQDVRTPGDR